MYDSDSALISMAECVWNSSVAWIIHKVGWISRSSNNKVGPGLGSHHTHTRARGRAFRIHYKSDINDNIMRSRLKGEEEEELVEHIIRHLITGRAHMLRGRMRSRQHPWAVGRYGIDYYTGLQKKVCFSWKWSNESNYSNNDLILVIVWSTFNFFQFSILSFFYF